MKSDLAAGRPVIYGGQSYRNDDEGTLAGGHAFIFDGYDTMDYFHVNWGWGGSCNGYYSTTVLRPMVQYDFTPLQYCIINLKPNTDNGAVIVMASDLEMDSERFASGGDISGHYSMTNIGDSAGSMYVGVNIYDGGGTYHGCVDGRKVTLGVGDTVRCDFAYPLMLETGTYSAVMQYSMDSFCAGNPVDNTLYLPDFDYVNTADFEVIDTFIRELTNLVVFVRFRGDPEITTPFMTFKDMFNQSINSVAYFFREMSYGRIHFNTTFAKQNSGNGVVSYVDPMPRGYFQPYSDSNTIGYTTPNPQVGISMREAELIARVARYIDSARKVPELESLDGNYDGNIDNLSIIVQGDVDGWGELLWPHMEFFPQDSMDNPVTINGKRVHAFNFEFEGSGPSYFSTRTFCHEMCHSIGLPDLYHYNHYTRVTAVPFDLMGSGLMCQPSGIYKHKVLKPTSPLFRGFDDEFYAPHSREIYITREQILSVPGLELMAESDEAGVTIVKTEDSRKFFVTCHAEYDSDTLANEYKRDLDKGIDPHIPRNYFPDDDPSRDPVVNWRSTGQLLYTNWLNYYVYQSTPYDVESIGDR